MTIPLASRRLRRLLVAFALPFALSTCDNSPEPALVATTITITPATTVALAAIGATRQLTAVVKDQNGDTLANAPVTWATSNGAVVTVSATGLATASGNGSAQVTATSGSATVSVTVTVAQTASRVVKVSGDSQTATVGQTLPQPIVVRVNDSTGHGVAGMSVHFAVASGSGSVGSASATTNSAGQAQSNWTLDTTTGSQTASATVTGSGISGNPAIFTATATALPPLALTPVVSGLSSPLYVTAPPDDTLRAFVVEQTGTIRVLRRDTLLATPFLDLSAIISCCGERGLLSMAFHPNYAMNGFFYVDFTALDGALTIVRYHISVDPNVADAASAETLLTVPHSEFANHNGGLVKFGPDGYLYIGTGDGGGGGDTLRNGQDSTQLLAKILRIDVDGGFPYAIPPTNPFASRPPARPEVWDYGVRNPWRFSFDRLTGDFYLGDVGQGLWEEIDFAPAGDPGGHNYGWNTMEGLHCYDPVTGCDMTGLVLPVYEYGHGAECSITGGHVYRGARYPAIAGRYFFGDYCAGWVRSLTIQGGVATNVVDHTELPLVPNLTSFGEDGRGELYVVSGSGTVYRITAQ